MVIILLPCISHTQVPMHRLLGAALGVEWQAGQINDHTPLPVIALMAQSNHLQGACGYGYIKKNEWPYWSVGALTPGNRFAKAGPAHACGCALPCLQRMCLQHTQRVIHV